ncbi:hypothetical protein D3C83_299690 [compost metagenome]
MDIVRRPALVEEHIDVRDVDVGEHPDFVVSVFVLEGVVKGILQAVVKARLHLFAVAAKVAQITML